MAKEPFDRERALDTFEMLLAESVRRYGHRCPGQVLGVRMAVLGCRLLDIEAPRDTHYRKILIVYVEMDRCAADAIQSVTGCSLGKRTLKFRDYGIMAATFLRLDSGLAYRVVAREDARRSARLLRPQTTDSFQQQLWAYPRMADEDLFLVQRVHVNLAEWDLPGPSRIRVTCSRCGEVIRDGKEVQQGLEFLCRPCNGEAYFSPCTSEGAEEHRCINR